MSVPGFTAEASLYRGDQTYIGRGQAEIRPLPGVVPQNLPCEIYIYCVDNIRYMKYDCPDGSGDTYRVGVCETRPAWPYARIWKHRPWIMANG
jgi:hypothetical protein